MSDILNTQPKYLSEKDLVIGKVYLNTAHGLGIFKGKVNFDEKEVYQFQFGKLHGITQTLLMKEEELIYLREYDSTDKKIKLNKLGSGDWGKQVKKLKESAKDTAEKLLNLAIKRKTLNKQKYNTDNILNEFESILPFEMSKGQIEAINDINNDLTISNNLMNRLVYGGCGSGKTTVLQYCMFLTYKNHFQTVLLCPAAILAEQHFNDCQKLFKDYNINIQLLTSKTTPKNKKLIYEGIESGTIDVVIGTTSICKEIKWNRLGMLLTDEPQKFGVLAKTFIKNLQSNIGTILATGTPLPRDFLEVESGIMDMSRINTYPKNKKPIITSIIKPDFNIIKLNIQKELDNNGKIYFVYNNVEELESMKQKLLNLVPELQIGIINGKMKKKNIEDTLIKFKNNEYNLLLSTSIIETGINIDVNTIFIYEADMWGLSSLLQVKNRVGRFGKQGFCFLVEPSNRAINDIAKKRLNIICKYNQLGQDINIAEEDRKIRGSGKIFGTEQKGHYGNNTSYYNELLSEAINKRKQEII